MAAAARTTTVICPPSAIANAISFTKPGRQGRPSTCARRRSLARQVRQKQQGPPQRSHYSALPCSVLARVALQKRSKMSRIDPRSRN